MAKRRGRVGKDVASLFSGLILDARDGSPYIVGYRPKKGVGARYGKNVPILRNKSSIQGKASAVTFWLVVFETGMLHHLQQNPPNDTLKELLDTIEATDNGNIINTSAPNRYGENRKALRLRLQRELRQVIESIYLLVVPRGRIRIATVQVCFSDKKWSNFRIVQFAAKSGRPLRKDGIPDRGGAWLFLPILSNHLDLRMKENVADQERVMQEMDTKELFLRIFS